MTPRTGILAATLVGLLAACGPTANPTVAAAAPTATQAMVCGDEIRGEIQQALALPAQPRTSSTFAADLFTCTYALPAGPMKLSVRHSASDAAALTYLNTRAAAIGADQPQQGLTEHAYATGAGVVLVLKDNETLEVDTTGLPTVFGTQGQKRVDLAYEIASVVLGCWTGDDH